MKGLLLVIVVVGLLFFFEGCRDTDEGTSSNSFAIEWSILNSQSEYSNQIYRQRECSPAIFNAKDEAIGTIFMVHGYSACPQQYFDWAERLSKAGYNIVIPTMPGHGLSFVNNTTKYESMFITNDKAAYENFASSIVSLARNSETPHNNIIVGLSVGGAVAAKAALEGQGVFKKTLLLSPFLAIPNSYSGLIHHALDETLNINEQTDILAKALSRAPDAQLNTISDIWEFIHGIVSEFRAGTLESIVALLKKSELLKNIDTGWGESCENERAHDRAGICTFKVGHLLEVDTFGRSVLNDYRNAQSLPSQFQIVGVENDDGSDSKARSDLYSYIAGMKSNGEHSMCLYPFGEVPHAFISKYDNIDLADENAVDIHESALENMLDMWLSVFLDETQIYFDSPDFIAFSNTDGMCLK